jgi:hypothetical protein
MHRKGDICGLITTRYENGYSCPASALKKLKFKKLFCFLAKKVVDPLKNGGRITFSVNRYA